MQFEVVLVVQETQHPVLQEKVRICRLLRSYGEVVSGYISCRLSLKPFLSPNMVLQFNQMLFCN